MKSSELESIRKMPKKCEKYSICAFFMFLLICLLGTSFAGESLRQIDKKSECLSLSTDHISHEIAINQLMNIAEVHYWEGLVKRNGRHASILSNSNNTVFRDGQCLWEINLYEVNNGQFLRWNSYQISIGKALAYRVDVVNPGHLTPVNFLAIKRKGAFNE